MEPIDVDILLDETNPADFEELEVLVGDNVRQTMLAVLDVSVEAYSVFDSEDVLVMSFGLAPKQEEGSYGSWFVDRGGLAQFPLSVMRVGRKIVKAWRETYGPTLPSQAIKKNKFHSRWLKSLGFNITREPHGNDRLIMFE